MVSQEVIDRAQELADNDPEHVKMRGLGIGIHTNSIYANGYETNRWQKHGHDRLYFYDRENQGHDGYIDLESGAVKGDTPICNVTVENIDGQMWTYYYMRVVDIDYEHEQLVCAVRR